MKKAILDSLIERRKKGIKSFAVLIDPDKVVNTGEMIKLVNLSVENKVDFFLVGGSLITSTNFDHVIALIMENSKLPVILFPGSNMHINYQADAILFLSLISGRNPELLIGQHVIAAPIVKKSDLEVLPTGYMLVSAGNETTVSYMSNTTPIPHDKPSVAVCTALAGEMLGLRLMYLDAGSGAQYPVSSKMIQSVRKTVKAPLIVGGGIDSVEKALTVLQAGADMIVVGNGIEKNPNLLIGVSDAVQQLNRTLNISI